MSERNVELTRRVVEAFNARDIEAIIAYCDPSIEYHSVLAGAVASLAVTTVLLSIALLFTRSLARAHSLNPGFDLQHTVWAKVTVLNDRYPKDQVYRFASRALDAARGTRRRKAILRQRFERVALHR